MSNPPQGRSVYTHAALPSVNPRRAPPPQPPPSHRAPGPPHPQPGAVYYAPAPQFHPPPPSAMSATSSTDLLAQRIMHQIVPVLSEHQVAFQSRLAALEQSVILTLQPFKNELDAYKKELETYKKELLLVFARADEQRRRDLQALADKMTQIEKTVGKGRELPGQEISLTDKLDKVAFVVEELLERFRDPKADEEPTIRHDASINTDIAAEIEPRALHHDMAVETSPIEHTPTPAPSYNAPATEQRMPAVLYNDIGTSPRKPKKDRSLRFPRTPPSSMTPEAEPPDHDSDKEDAEEEENTSKTLYTSTSSYAFSPVDWAKRHANLDVMTLTTLKIPPPPFEVSVQATQVASPEGSQIGLPSAGPDNDQEDKTSSRSHGPKEYPEDDLLDFSPNPTPSKASREGGFGSSIAGTSTPFVPLSQMASGSRAASAFDDEFHVPSSRSPSPIVLPSPPVSSQFPQTLTPRHTQTQSQTQMPYSQTQAEEDFVAQMITRTPPPSTPGPSTARAHTYTSDIDDELSDLSELSSIDGSEGDESEDEAHTNKKLRLASEPAGKVKREAISASPSKKRGRLPKSKSKASGSAPPVASSSRMKAEDGKGKKRKRAEGKEGDKKEKKRIHWPTKITDDGGASMKSLVECEKWVSFSFSLLYLLALLSFGSTIGVLLFWLWLIIRMLTQISHIGAHAGITSAAWASESETHSWRIPKHTLYVRLVLLKRNVSRFSFSLPRIMLTQTYCTANKKFSGIEGRCARPRCDIIGSDDDYFVERIIGRRIKIVSGQKSWLWLIKWLEYPIDRATWESSDALSDPALIDDFEKDVKAEGITDGGQEVILLQEALDGGWCVEDPDIKPLPKDGAV
ncbi:hypothetical protein VNI00_012881 [Paramarasmius palmivorus]|uniref:Chromo domain-containing protein n=1 Tax=Paramarasmius palmivorus TaxID=297713 RepID=A0AAW0C229_9AGAR